MKVVYMARWLLLILWLSVIAVWWLTLELNWSGLPPLLIAYVGFISGLGVSILFSDGLTRRVFEVPIAITSFFVTFLIFDDVVLPGSNGGLVQNVVGITLVFAFVIGLRVYASYIRRTEKEHASRLSSKERID